MNKNAAISIIVLLLIALSLITAGSQGSIMIDDGYPLIGGYPLFAVCGSIGLILHWIFFIPSYLLKTDHYFDLIGSISYVITAITAAILNQSLDMRGMIICGMIVLWATRLGLFLFTRIKQDGKDVRLDVIKTQFMLFLRLWTFGGLWVLATAGAGLAAMTSSTPLEIGIIGYIGITLWVFGFMVEVMADSQKRQFRKDPKNKGRFISTGLWSWSQHPNYFGEITLWFGIALLAYPALDGWQLVTLISPVFVSLLLTKVSGINLLDEIAQERWGSDPEYLEYKNRTSKLILSPPKK